MWGRWPGTWLVKSGETQGSWRRGCRKWYQWGRGARSWEKHSSHTTGRFLQPKWDPRPNPCALWRKASGDVTSNESPGEGGYGGWSGGPKEVTRVLTSGRGGLGKTWGWKLGGGADAVLRALMGEGLQPRKAAGDLGARAHSGRALHATTVALLT